MMNPLWGGTDFGPRSFPPVIKKKEMKNDNESVQNKKMKKKFGQLSG